MVMYTLENIFIFRPWHHIIELAASSLVLPRRRKNYIHKYMCFFSVENAQNSNRQKYCLLLYSPGNFVFQSNFVKGEAEMCSKKKFLGRNDKKFLSLHWATTALLSVCSMLKRIRQRKQKKKLFCGILLVDCLLMQFYDWPFCATKQEKEREREAWVTNWLNWLNATSNMVACCCQAKQVAEANL